MKKELVKLLALSAAALSLAACTSSETDKSDAEDSKSAKTEQTQSASSEETKKADEPVVDDWDGDWKSILTYLDDGDLADTWAEAAEKESTTPEEAEKDFRESRHTDFAELKVADGKIQFIDADGNVLDESSYTYKDSHEVGHGVWNAFTADKEDAKYPVILLMEVHGEESLIHFHIRTGNDEQSLLDQEDWYATMVKPTTTLDQVKEEILE